MPVQSWWHQRSPSTGSKSSDDYDSQDPSTSGLSHKDLDLSPRTEHFRGGDGISPNTCTTSSFRANASTPKEISSITSEAYALKRASSRAKRGSAGPESNGLVLLLEVERLQDALEKKSKEVRLLHRCISEKDQLLREEAVARMRAECVQDQLDFARKQLTARDMNREVNTKWLVSMRTDVSVDLLMLRATPDNFSVPKNKSQKFSCSRVRGCAGEAAGSRGSRISIGAGVRDSEGDPGAVSLSHLQTGVLTTHKLPVGHHRAMLRLSRCCVAFGESTGGPVAVP